MKTDQPQQEEEQSNNIYKTRAKRTQEEEGNKSSNPEKHKTELAEQITQLAIRIIT